MDVLAVVRAAGQNLIAGRIVSGASTITQQLARLTYPGPRTYGRKLLEMVRSLRIERTFTKEEILRCYLDRVPLGYNLVGVESAALASFGRRAAALTTSQAALLAALAKAPGALRPNGPRHARLVTRQRWVLGRMASLGLLCSKELDLARVKAETGERLSFALRMPWVPWQSLHRGGRGSPFAVACPWGDLAWTSSSALWHAPSSQGRDPPHGEALSLRGHHGSLYRTGMRGLIL